MRNIRVATVDCMTGLTRKNGELTAQFVFPETYLGFQGHFPERKILPGVCQIHCVLALLEQGEGVKVTLREIVLAKYTAPVFPGDTLVCTVERLAEDRDETLVRSRLTANDKKVTELKLRVVLDAQPGNPDA